ncbi:RNA polymerase sigma factor [Planctobacterium marinum]|uniref:RNA polymerase sigma factor n=1 Tax=Planctobacterium marinum TaxID=1631968 RepID=UPI001E40040F|nr:RNA polymerase sigma factor [Planctobacterium marinum]MCC2605459.1 RNA polymerase sigma factor [Planctobacterium marinum]
MTSAATMFDNHTTSDQEVFDSLDAFLAYIEKRAYRMALLAVGQHADAIDILQDAMMKLVTNYGDRPGNEWRPLFYRILNNRITDWHRQQKSRSRLFFWRTTKNEDDSDELCEQVPDEKMDAPAQALNKVIQQQDMLQTIEKLPLKQQQCFLLRSWEGLSVAETADIMGCSQGSVKTHFFRAVQKLKAVLEEQHDIVI